MEYGVYREMIRYLKEEPSFKKGLIWGISIIITFYIGFAVFQYSELIKIHKTQINTFQQLVGVLVSEYPEKELEIVSTIIKDSNMEFEKIGENSLRKYGYDIDTSMKEDIKFIAYRNNFIKINVTIVAILVLINIFIVMITFQKSFNYLELVSKELNKFIKGDYTNSDYGLKEGIIARVSNQINQLGNIIYLKQEKLISEKENAKALVTDISHQLKTPLASVKMCNALLKEDLSLEERDEFLNSSEIAVRKLEYLVDSLVNISRLEADMIKIKPTNNSIKNTITNAINSVYIKAMNKNIDIGLNEFEDVMIPHDSKWTEEAIFNVLENGVKYTKVGGYINISVEETPNFLRINIKDNGIGIKKEEFNSIFKRFYRGKSKEIKNIEGSGVGLYLTRKIIEEQGGSITVKSKENVGTEFIILMRKLESSR